jgi:hypothetical protein
MMYIVNDELIPEANKMHSLLADSGVKTGSIPGYAFD